MIIMQSLILIFVLLLGVSFVMSNPVKLVAKHSTYHTFYLYDNHFSMIFNINPLDSVDVKIDPNTNFYKGFGYNIHDKFSKKEGKKQIENWKHLVDLKASRFKTHIKHYELMQF